MKQPLPDFIRVGVTGIAGAIPSVSPKEFRMLCYSAARVTGGAILGFDPAPFHTIKNFHLAVLQHSYSSGDLLTFLLLNHHTPLLACASAHDLTFHLPFTFIDASPELIAPFESLTHILKKQELDQPWIWTEQELALSLSPQEIRAIIYWKPRTIGEALFNFWD